MPLSPVSAIESLERSEWVGGVLLTHAILDGRTAEFRRYLSGGKIVQEMEFEGVMCTRLFSRQARP